MRFKAKAYAMCAIFAAGSALPASAATTISSSAYGISANLSVLGLVNANLGPVGAVAGSAPPAYDKSGSVVSVNQNLSLLATGLLNAGEHIGTGLVTTTASSPYPAIASGNASATIDGLSTALTTQVLLAPVLTLLGVSANTIQSTSGVSAAGGLNAFGTSTIEGLTVTGLSLGLLRIDGGLFINPDPNTVLVDILGLRIVLNEQVLGGNGVTDLSLATNALHISFDNFALGTGLLSGDVIVGHSQAAITDYVAPVPEPATWAMMIGGFGLIGVSLRRRRPIRVAA